MSHTFESIGHTLLRTGDEASYTFVHDQGLTSGGTVKILAWNDSVDEPGPAGLAPKKLGEVEVHKDALIAFVAHLVRGAKVAQAEGQGDMQVLGL
jgi:hypothetical protein